MGRAGYAIELTASMNTQSLSLLGQRAVSNPIRADFDFFDEVMQDRYEASTNAGGKIPLCIAENVIGWKALSQKLSEISRDNPLPDWVAGYTATVGHPDFRAALAKFLTQQLGGRSLDPDCLAISAGATGVIETTAFLLGNPGDYAVIPGPAYSVYTGDIGNKAGLRRYDLHLGTRADRTGIYRLTTSDLDRAYADLGNRFRLLLLTQPNNPTGQIYLEEDILNAVAWCEDHDVHCVVNEIYALSTIDQTEPALLEDYDSQQVFKSCLPQLEARKSDYFHWWYSFSKDFGVSGLRIGVLYSENRALLNAYANYAAPVTTSNHTQWLLSELLKDGTWITNWMVTERDITQSYLRVIRILRRAKIPYQPAVGSLFVWFDLSTYLKEDTDAAWEALWRDLYQQTGVLLTYPLGMGGPRRGWMRLVYSCVHQAELDEALSRLAGYLKRST